LSGEPFIVHPLAVAHICADLKMDDATICAALLHDVLEDSSVAREELVSLFGEEVVQLVEGITKLKLDFNPASREEVQIENYRRFFIAVARDIRVVILKLADRLHNMRTLKYQYRDKKEEIARETLEIYAPLAHRLGMAAIQVELENLSLFFLEPETYLNLQRKVERIKKEREQQIKVAEEILKERLRAAGISAEIQSRFKHIYSIYRKISRQNVRVEELHDLVAMRVITNTVSECYAVLGIVHELWSPVEGRFKDYIAVPKSNMYQSLHTTVIGPAGKPMEIQIRTWDMHRTAEYGIAAHWKYKEGKKLGEKDVFDERINWLRQILEWQQDLKSTREFMDDLKISLFDDEVYVFTPKGDLKKLPRGSTPIDFAYLIHTEVGNSCIGAKVNNKIVPLDYQLRSGDIVEILTSRSSSGPSPDWLSMCKTPGARNRIRAFLRKKNREINLEKGKKAFDKEMSKYTLSPAQESLVSANLKKFLEDNSLKTLEDLYIAIGEGRYSARRVINRIIPYSIRKHFLDRRKSSPGIFRKGEEAVIIQGASGLEVKLARCCAPLPGDPICGFVTRGKGITVHRGNCPNLRRNSFSKDRVLEAEWDRSVEALFPVGVVVEAVDRPKLLADVSGVVSNCQLEIKAVKAHSSGIEARIHFVVEVHDREELLRLLGALKEVKSVKVVRRGGVISAK